MGFLANMAAKSEMKVRDQALAFLRELQPEWTTGNVLLPCHIVIERHNGFFVDTGAVVVGVFRCQLHWWAYELDANVLNGLRSPNSAQWLGHVSQSAPTDLGSLEGGIYSVAAGLAATLPSGTDDAKPTSVSAPSMTKATNSPGESVAAASSSDVPEMVGDVAAILSQLPWLTLSHLRLPNSSAYGIHVDSPYSGENVLVISDGRWVLWRPRPEGQPRFAHELDLPAEIPAPFLAGQFANVEFQDMLTILQEEGGAYIRDNHPSYWAHSQHVIPFWMWLGGTLDASEVDYQPLLDNMITTYVDHYEDQLTGLLDAPRSEG